MGYVGHVVNYALRLPYSGLWLGMGVQLVLVLIFRIVVRLNVSFPRKFDGKSLASFV